MSCLNRTPFLTAVVFLSATVASFAASGIDSYQHDIKPLLQARCVACHGALKSRGGLRLDTAELLRRGGDDGRVIDPSDVDASELIRRVSTSDESERMPPEGEALRAEQIAALKKWIAAGAPGPEDEQPEADPREHWAYRPIIKPPLPEASFEGNPIDAFVAAKLAGHGINPQPQASRSVLLRRAHLDLTGLPPSREELVEFRGNKSERAYERMIGRLLASPHYGERWGRHWMDIWRYSDWFGLGKQLRNSQKHIWHWRDWIVESLNEDKRYDRMILEMLAGDEVAPTDRKTLRATGYLARNYYLFNRDTWLDATVEHTAKAFLGLTMNCVKCHDHKYDPIEMPDYYAFRAFFEPHQIRLDQEPGVMDFEKGGLPRAFDDHLDAPTYIYRQGNDKDPDKSKVIEPALPALFASHDFEIKPVDLPAFAYAPGARDYVQKDHLAKAETDIANAEGELVKARQRLAKVEKEREGKGNDGNDAEPSKPIPFLKDDFSKARSDLWLMSGEGWEYKGGKLLQNKPGTDRHLRSKKAHPENFRAVFRYKPTGGAKWKSMSLRFDVVDGGKTSHTAYLSAVAPGSKAQISHTENGRNSYPADGRKAMPVKLDEVYEMEIAVRGYVINFWVNGELTLAYRLPYRKPDGRFELSAFDLTAELLSLEIESLPDHVALTQPNGAPHMANTLAGARAGVELAERGVAQAEENLAALKARIAADRAMVKNPESNAAGELAAAAKATRKAALARADHELARADHELARLSALAKPDKKKLAEAEKKLKAARASRGKTQEALKKTDREYVSLKGSLKALETPAHKLGQYAPTYSRKSSGRRTALAKWIGSRGNPLTARVAVNHIWMRHFGEPLVEQVFDFGRRAKEPEHLELLNYLAADFMENGWSMKRLHKLLMTSEAYRRSSSNAGADAEAISSDPDNHLYWRMNPRRMESQIIRDSALHLAAELRAQLGGPAIDPKKKDTAMRRSIYFAHSRDDGVEFLKSFDDAEITQCYRRSESVVPLQALAMANAEISINMAGRIAAKLPRVGDDQSLVAAVFETVLSRAPTTEEKTEAVRFLAEMRELLKTKKVADREQRARARLVHALLNHNDFITIR